MPLWGGESYLQEGEFEKLRSLFIKAYHYCLTMIFGQGELYYKTSHTHFMMIFRSVR